MTSPSLSADRKVTLMTATMTVVAGLLLGAIAPLGDSTPLVDAPLRWWYFIPLFALVEWAVVHIEVRNESYGLALSEPVMLIGLLCLSPIGLLAARVIGGAVALRARKQSPAKTAFNLAMFALQIAFSAFVLHRLVASHASGQLLWACGVGLVLVSVLLGDTLVTVVISFYDRARPAKLALATARSDMMMSLATSSITLLGLAAVFSQPLTAIALAVVLIGAAVLLREQAATVNRASNLNMISEFTTTLAGLGTTDEVMQALVDQSAALLRGAHGAAVVSSLLGQPETSYVFDADGERNDVLPPMIAGAVLGLTKPALLTDLRCEAGNSLGCGGVAAPLRVGEGGGVVVIWDRSTAVGSFDDGDLRLLSALVAQTEITAQRSLLGDQLALAAHHDSLTGLPNRLGFEVAVAESKPTQGALLLIDLNRFKDLNDTLGHPTGDRALIIIANRLADLVRSSAAIARLGGDEFALFDPAATDAAAAAGLARRVVEAIEEPIELMQLSLHVGASVGIALMPADGADLMGLMTHADVAMYAAKDRQSGWEFYRSEDDTNSPRRLELLAGLRPAIDLEELDVWYQPKVRASDGVVVGLEALARWQHPRFGFVPPDEFIALAEGAGLMRDLTDFVLSRSMKDAARRRDAGWFLPVAVNLSTRNLLDDTLADRMAELLAANGIGPELINFEVTETAVMVDRQRVLTVLDAIKSMGFRIAVDDYGTGYSSLAYLRDLPVDELKIDRVFITDVDIDQSNHKIVKSTIELAHGFGLDVVAEGVERPGEWQALRRLGCDLIQGYFFARPLASDLLDRWLAEYDPTQLGETTAAR